MNCTNSQTFAHEYSCDIRNVNSANCKSKLLVSRCNRSDVSNLLDEIRLALSADFEFWISYTRLLLSIEVSWNDQDSFVCFAAEISRLMCVCFFFKIWRIAVIAIFASISWNFETWKSTVIVIFASEIIHLDFNQSALKIWKSFSWVTQKKHSLMISLSVAFNIESLISYNSQFSIWWLTADWVTERSNSNSSLFSHLFTLEFSYRNRTLQWC